LSAEADETNTRLVAEPDSGHSSGAWAVATLLGVTALTLLYPLVTLGVWMMSRDYYQHFPLLLLGGLGLAAFQLRDHRPEWVAVVSSRVMLWATAAVVATVLVYVIPSRWMAGAAGLCCLIAALQLAGGRELTNRLSGPLMLMVAALPLPVNLDTVFVVWLQRFATWISSLWLDLAGVMHLATGTAIRTAEQQYMVEDACSGVHSVFAAIAVGVGYAVLRHYDIGRTLVVVLQLLVWVVVANAARVFAMVYGQERLDINLSNPAYHQLLGFLTFSLAILLALSSDHLIRYIRPLELTEDNEPVSRANRPVNTTFLDQPVSLNLAGSLVGLLGVLGVIFGTAFYRFETQPMLVMPIEEMAKLAIVDLSAGDAELLPATLGDWKRVGFRTQDAVPQGYIVRRDGEHDLAIRARGGGEWRSSLDGPYDSWHDLGVCYTGVGWRIEDRLTTDVGPEDDGLVACDLRLTQEPIGHSQVLYVCVDPSGEAVPPPSYYGRAVANFFERARTLMQDRPASKAGVVQLQLVDQRMVKIDDRDRAENKQLFDAAVEHLFRGPGAAVGQSSPGG